MFLFIGYIYMISFSYAFIKSNVHNTIWDKNYTFETFFPQLGK